MLFNIEICFNEQTKMRAAIEARNVTLTKKQSFQLKSSAGTGAAVVCSTLISAPVEMR